MGARVGWRRWPARGDFRSADPWSATRSCRALATAYVLIGYGAGANLGSLQYHWASATAVIQIALTSRSSRCDHQVPARRWLRIAVGAALLAGVSLRAITL